MDVRQTLARRFNQDIDRICEKFIAAYALKFKQEIDHLSSPLYRWLDFRYRYIDPQPRPVAFSDRFPKALLPKKARAGLKHLVRLIQAGGDINPYQGRGLILRNDTSGGKKDSRTDLLWADWGVFHFHLTADPIPDGQFFSKAADYLAFCLVGGNVVAFIDVLRHPDKKGFANQDLMETLYRNWPEYLDQFKMNGIMAGSQMSNEDIHDLRSAGISPPLVLGGNVYMNPGMGITSAGTSTKISLVSDRVRDYIDGVVEVVLDPCGQFQSEMQRLGIGEPGFSLDVTPSGLAIYEAGSSTAFLLPKLQPNSSTGFLAELRNMIAPDWAVESLMSSGVPRNDNPPAIAGAGGRGGSSCTCG
jgi:hypothetical protein